VERFARANPHLLPHLGLRKPPGHTILTLLLHRLDPEKLQEAPLQVFPGADPGEVLVHLRGSGRGKSPQVRLVEVLALGLRTTPAQAKAEGLKGKVVPKGGVPLRPEGEPGRAIGVGPGGVQGHGGEAASRRDRGGVEPGAGWGGVDLPGLGLPLLAGYGPFPCAGRWCGWSGRWCARGRGRGGAR
jgi:fructokinase